MLHALMFAAVVLAADPGDSGLDVMKAELEARIEFYQRLTTVEGDVRSLKERMDALEEGAPESSDPAQSASSPEAVATGLALLKLQKRDVLLDPGCGDGRVIVTAAKEHGCRSLGIEIDKDQADVAARLANENGVEGKAMVLLGDFNNFNFAGIGATCAYVYLYPGALAEIAPKLTALERFVSYMHDVPGVKTRKVGDFYVWERHAQAAAEKPTVETKVVAARPYAVWGGRTYYQEYNPRCGCQMCSSIRSQLAIPRTTTVTVQPEQQAKLPELKFNQPAGSWQWRCVNGVCGWYLVPGGK